MPDIDDAKIARLREYATTCGLSLQQLHQIADALPALLEKLEILNGDKTRLREELDAARRESGAVAGYVPESTYQSAVKGRQDFRVSYRRLRAAIQDALGHLKDATPKTRNGPCIQAIATLRAALEARAEPGEEGGE